MPLKAERRPEEETMTRSIRLLMLAFLMITASVASITTRADRAYNWQAVSDYHQVLPWWHHRLFPRWNDIYVVVFEQEMLV